MRLVTPEHQVALFVVTRAQVRQGGELRSESGIDSADGQVAGIAEVVLLRRDRVCIRSRVRSG